MENPGRVRVVGAILLVAVIVTGICYFYYRNQLDIAVSVLEISLDGVEVRGFRVLPSPEANVTLTYVINNTKIIGFSVALDGELYYGDSFITPLTVEETYIRGDGLSIIEMDITLTGSILNTIDPENQGQYKVQGELRAVKRVLGIPIAVKKSLSDYRSNGVQ